MEIIVMIGQLILGLSILVGLHEMGHLLAAKAFGMRVEQFSIGFPPKIFGRKFGETEYTLGAIPLGGFVKISGMVDESLDKNQLAGPPQPWEFRSKPAWQRLIVMMGGIIVNVITGIIIYSAIVFTYGESYLPAREARYGIVAHDLAQQIGLQTGDKILEVNGKSLEKFSDIASPELLLGSNSQYTVERNGDILNIPVPNNLVDVLSSGKDKLFVSPIAPFSVGKVSSGMPAERAGIKDGDYITTVAGKPVKFFHELQAALEAQSGKKVPIEIVRNSQTQTVTANITSDGKLGFMPKFLLKEDTQQYTFIESVPRGAKLAVDVVWLNIKGFGKIFRGEVSATNAVSGPIAMAKDLYGGLWDWQNFWRITGLLSMVLAFMNFLPIPALDGGHVMFLLWEMVTRRKPSDKFMEGAQKVGMALLLSLMVFAVFNDVFKSFR